MQRPSPIARSLALSAGFIAMRLWAGASQPLPTPFPQARYQQMSARSPFVLATAATPQAAPTPGFASQLYVDGIAHVGDTDFVAIKSRNPTPGKPVTIFLAVGQSTEDGMKVDRVQWSDQMGKSTVNVSKGGERATLIFDEAQIAKAAPMIIPQPMRYGYRPLHRIHPFGPDYPP